MNEDELGETGMIMDRWGGVVGTVWGFSLGCDMIIDEVRVEPPKLFGPFWLLFQQSCLVLLDPWRHTYGPIDRHCNLHMVRVK
jgi:hypothetical protein